MENQKPLTTTQIELIRLVMKPASDEEVIREMQGIISRFKVRSSPGAKPGSGQPPAGRPQAH